MTKWADEQPLPPVAPLDADHRSGWQHEYAVTIVYYITICSSKKRLKKATSGKGP